MRARLLCAVGAALVVGMSLLVVWACATDVKFGLDVTVVGQGEVTVREGSGSDPVLVCGPGDPVPCTTQVAENSTVELQAAPLERWRFESWGGVDQATEVTSTDPPAVKFDIAANRSITATFVQVRSTLTVIVEGPGTVTALAPAIVCDEATSPCTLEADHGASVTLAAEPGLNHDLLEWTGDAGRSEERTLQVVLDRDEQVTATFRPLHKLTVDVVGSGTVTGEGAAIACPGTCVAPVVQGRQVTLAAAPAKDRAFVGWGGAFGSSASLALDFVMGAADAAVTATFTGAEPESTFALVFPEVPVIATCGAHRIPLQPRVLVAFPVDRPVFTFFAVQGPTAIPVTPTTWNAATKRATRSVPTSADGSVVLPVPCLNLSDQTNVSYRLEFDLTFTTPDLIEGYLVVHQEMSPDCGPSLCMTRYQDLRAIRAALPPAKTSAR